MNAVPAALSREQQDAIQRELDATARDVAAIDRDIARWSGRSSLGADRLRREGAESSVAARRRGWGSR